MKLAHAGMQIGATGICELLDELSRPGAKEENASDRYARIANSTLRLARMILTLDEHRERLAKEKAAELKQLDPKRELDDDEHLAIVDHVNRLFGLRQYRRPEVEATMFGSSTVAANARSKGEAETLVAPVATAVIPAATAVDPHAANPDCAGARSGDPMAGSPDPASAPDPFATNPDVSGAG